MREFKYIDIIDLEPILYRRNTLQDKYCGLADTMGDFENQKKPSERKVGVGVQMFSDKNPPPVIYWELGELKIRGEDKQKLI